MAAVLSSLSSSVIISFTFFCFTNYIFSISINTSWGAEARESHHHHHHHHHHHRHHHHHHHHHHHPIPISSLIRKELFEALFLHKDDNACPAKHFYTYHSFIKAAKSFPRFGTTGGLRTRKREIAAFLGQISHETSGGWAATPHGPYAWGLCYIDEVSPKSHYCNCNTTKWPCYPGKSYKGRGPLQLSWNFNYGPAGKALGFDGLKNPEVVANNSLIAFKTALWFWMTEQNPKPSCHNVMVGRYVPTEEDMAANRRAGYGLVTNIINGGECGKSNDRRVNGRIGYFKRYAKLFNVDTGSNVDCENQTSFQ